MIADIDQIERELDASLPTISETLFRRDFLPFFTHNIPDKDIPLALSAWIHGVAGSSSTPVKVIDRNHNVLFTVPPLVDLTRAVVTDPNHFEHAVAAHQVLSLNMPEVAEVLMKEEMTSAMQNSIEISSEDNWQPMLAYYGLDRKEAAVVQPTSTSSVLDDLGL